MHHFSLQRCLSSLSLGLGLMLTPVHAEIPKVGSLAPEFTLVALNKTPVSLSALRAKGHVMLIFWETQCVYCYAHIKDFNALQKKYQGKLTIAGINFLGEYPREVQEYAADNQVEYLLLADRLKNIDVAEAYQVIGSPTIVLIAPDGKILSYGYQIPDVAQWIK